jgi:hypothetical protein
MIKFIALLFVCAVNMLAVARYQYYVTQGPRACFAGQVCWYRVVAYPSNVFPITNWQNDGKNVTATGSSALADGAITWFAVDAGGSLPNTLNQSNIFIKCATVGDVAQYAMGSFDNGACGGGTGIIASDFPTYYPTGHGGTTGNTWVGQGDPGHSVGSSVQFQTVSLPAGVTVGGTFQGQTYVVQEDHGSTRPTAPTAGGWPASTNGQFPLIVPLVVAPGATPGSYTAQFTLHCTTTTVECLATDQPVEFPFEIVANPSIPVSHPSPITPVDPGTLSAIEGRINTGLTLYCNKTTGVVNYTPLSSLQISTAGEGTIWYYNAGWLFYMWAQYTGDSDWNRCGDSMARDYSQAIQSFLPLGNSNTQRKFPDGPKRLCSTCNLIGKFAIPSLGTGNINLTMPGQFADLAIRENAYNLNWLINMAKMEDGAATFTQLQTKNPSRAAEMQKSASMLMSILMQENDPNSNMYGQQQSFMWGLAHHSLIAFDYFWGDATNRQLTLAVIKRDLDLMMGPTMFDLSATFPGEVTWKRGEPMWTTTLAQNYGPNCPGNCGGVNGRQSEGLNYMFMEGWGWYYWMTNDTTYRDFGDDLAGVVAGRWPNTGTGKLTSEMTLAIHWLSWRTAGIPYLP